MKSSLKNYFALLMLLACDSEKEKFTLVDQKKEKDNTMDLYANKSNLGKEDFIEFCTELKSEYSSGMFHYFVFFDSEESAVFPNNPLTAGHNEDEAMRHIQAVYTYCPLNGNSFLTYYKENQLESVPEEIAIK